MFSSQEAECRRHGRCVESTLVPNAVLGKSDRRPDSRLVPSLLPKGAGLAHRADGLGHARVAFGAQEGYSAVVFVIARRPTQKEEIKVRTPHFPSSTNHREYPVMLLLRIPLVVPGRFAPGNREESDGCDSELPDDAQV